MCTQIYSKDPQLTAHINSNRKIHHWAKVNLKKKKGRKNRKGKLS